MRVVSYGELATFGQQNVETRFAQADAMVRTSFRQMVEQGDVLGAFPFGSTQFGDYNSLSDYDIAVMIPEVDAGEETRIFAALHQTAVNIYRQTQVPLEVSCYTDAQIAAMETPTLPAEQIAWLQGQRNRQPHNVIGADFVPKLQPPRLGESYGGFEALDSYVDRTRHLLKKSWMQGCYPRPYDLLSVVLGVPHVAGRRILDKLQNDTDLGTETLLSDMKKDTIAQAARDFFGTESATGQLYMDLHADTRRYSELVTHVVDLREDEYEQLVTATLDEDLPKSIELLRRMQEEYRAFLNRTAGYTAIRMQPYIERGSNETFYEYNARLVSEIRLDQMNS